MDIVSEEEDIRDEAGGDRVTFGPDRQAEETEMDMTPMVNVTFLLLIFFMVTAAFTLQKSLQVPKPDPTDEPSSAVQQDDQEDQQQVTIIIDEFNTFRVLTADAEFECPSEQELLIRLREAKRGAPGLEPPNKLVVKANMEALHEKVVLAIDAGADVGFEQVQLMSVEDDA